MWQSLADCSCLLNSDWLNTNVGSNPTTSAITRRCMIVEEITDRHPEANTTQASLDKDFIGYIFLGIPRLNIDGFLNKDNNTLLMVSGPVGGVMWLASVMFKMLRRSLRYSWPKYVYHLITDSKG